MLEVIIIIVLILAILWVSESIPGKVARLVFLLAVLFAFILMQYGGTIS